MKRRQFVKNMVTGSLAAGALPLAGMAMTNAKGDLLGASLESAVHVRHGLFSLPQVGAASSTFPVAWLKGLDRNTFLRNGFGDSSDDPEIISVLVQPQADGAEQAMQLNLNKERLLLLFDGKRVALDAASAFQEIIEFKQTGFKVFAGQLSGQSKLESLFMCDRLVQILDGQVTINKSRELGKHDYAISMKDTELHLESAATATLVVIERSC